MRKFNHPRVFDEFVMGTTTYTTSSEFNELLGSADQLAIIAVTDAYSGGSSPTLTVQIQVSGDGRNWVNKNATAEINAKPISATATSVVSGGDGGTNPAMGFVRLAVSASAPGAAPNQVHVRIGVCGREKEKEASKASVAQSRAPLPLSGPLDSGMTLSASDARARGAVPVPGGCSGNCAQPAEGPPPQRLPGIVEAPPTCGCPGEPQTQFVLLAPRPGVASPG